MNYSYPVFPAVKDENGDYVPGCALCETPIETRELPSLGELGESGLGWGADGALCEICADAARDEPDTRETDIPKTCPGWGG